MAEGGGSLLTFRVADKRFALDARRVAEVALQPRLTRVPHAPPSLAGVASLRGRVLPVIALGRLLGVGSDEAAAGKRLIVLQGADAIGLAVDEVLGLEAGEGEGLVMTEGGAARVVPLERVLDEAFSGRLRRERSSRPASAVARPAGGGSADMAVLAVTLAEQPYGLPLAHVREVIAAPPDVVLLPRTDAAMLGVATLRGALTPIVSTRVLLGLPAAALTPATRIVIASIGEARVGLAVDEIRMIVRAPMTAVGRVPKVLNRGAGEAKVTAMLRTGSGGLISLIEPDRLFAEESVAQILEDGRGAADTGAAAQAETSYRFVIFELSGETYGVDVAAVEEVVALPERLTRVPGAPTYVLGVMNLRGAAVPVIDQRRRFEVAAAQAAARPRVIVMRIGDLVAGFAVDAVTQILQLPASRLSPTPELAEGAGQLFDRIAQVEADGQVILLVNPRELLDRAERDLVAALAAGATPA